MRHKAAAIVFLSPDGRVLLLRRSQAIHRPGLWNLPGGRRDPGEVPEETAVREAWEEAGLVAPEPRYLVTLDKRYVLYLQPVPFPVDPNLNWESDAYVWAYPEAAADDLPMLPNLRPFLRALARARRA